MNEVNKTLYIPLYGKAMVSKQGILLSDPKAEQIWQAEGFTLKGKAKSKWLTYYMGMRSAVFDRWLADKMEALPEAVILHIGCGMDSRICRIGHRGHLWYDLDFPDVIAQRKKHYEETEHYHMIASDVRTPGWMDTLPGTTAIVVMEGISMYLRREELCCLLAALNARFENLHILMDCYTEFAAKASKYKNPVNEVGVTTLYGLDDPKLLESPGLRFVREWDFTPEDLIAQLPGSDRWFFRAMFAGSAAKKIYRLYELERTP